MPHRIRQWGASAAGRVAGVQDRAGAAARPSVWTRFVWAWATAASYDTLTCDLAGYREFS
jgi:hypothetical protein